MVAFLDLLVWNVLIMSALAGIVWLASRTRMLHERPALRHGLWFVVLMKLVALPVIHLPLLPADVSQSVSTVSDESVSGGTRDLLVIESAQGSHPESDDRVAGGVSMRPVSEPYSEHGNERAVSLWTGGATKGATQLPVSPGDMEFSPRERLSIQSLLVVSLTVTFCLLAVLLRQAWRVRRLLGRLDGESNRLDCLLREVAGRFRLNCLPRVLVLDDSLSPMLWAGFGRSAIVLPDSLTQSMSDEQLRHVLAHELAHFVRRDHWTNLFACLVTSLFWWNPIAWLARRELRAAAESCCDALAINRLSGSRKMYAETLLTTVDFVSDNITVRPSLAIRFGEARSLKRRIEMIANPEVRMNLSRSGLLLIACGIVCLCLQPVRAQQQTPSPQPDDVSEPLPVTDTVQPAADSPAGNADNVAQPPAVADGTTPSTAEPDQTAQQRYLLPDYLPAAHGNAVESLPNHYFMLQPLGDPRQWRVAYSRDSGDGSGSILFDTMLRIPPEDELAQGDTFALHTGRRLVFIAYVENEYANDRDIGVKIIDIESGSILHECTLLRNVARYQWMADSMGAPTGKVSDIGGVRPVETVPLVFPASSDANPFTEAQP